MMRTLPKMMAREAMMQVVRQKRVSSKGERRERLVGAGGGVEVVGSVGSVVCSFLVPGGIYEVLGFRGQMGRMMRMPRQPRSMRTGSPGVVTGPRMVPRSSPHSNSKSGSCMAKV